MPSSSRARLLDLGEVAPVRSQSLYRALASLPGPPRPPVLVLSMPASALVLAGRDGELAPGEIESCRQRRVPVLPWPGAGVRRLDRDRLLFQLVVTAPPAGEHGWAATAAGRDRVGRLVAAACRRAGAASARAAGGEVVSENGVLGALEVCAVGESAVTIGDLAVAAGGGGGLDPALLAEALVSTLEEALGVEFDPSLPTPEELEAIYLHDEALAREERSGLGRPAAVGGRPA